MLLIVKEEKICNWRNAGENMVVEIGKNFEIAAKTRGSEEAVASAGKPEARET